MSLAEMKSKPVVHHTPRGKKKGRMYVLGWRAWGEFCLATCTVGRHYASQRPLLEDVASIIGTFRLVGLECWVAGEPRKRRWSRKGPRCCAEPHAFGELRVEAEYQAARVTKLQLPPECTECLSAVKTFCKSPSESREKFVPPMATNFARQSTHDTSKHVAHGSDKLLTNP